MRHFTTPSGRHWTADLCRILQCSVEANTSIAISGSVLRFTSNTGVTFDLEDWPTDWQSLDDHGLSELLRHAAILSTQTRLSRVS